MTPLWSKDEDAQRHRGDPYLELKKDVTAAVADAMLAQLSGNIVLDDWSESMGEKA